MKKFGYTMIELMVVIAIMGVIGLLSIYGLRSSDDSQIVTSAAKELAGNLRSLQNKAINGSKGSNCFVMQFAGSGSMTYNMVSTVDSFSQTIPNGVLMTAYDNVGIPLSPAWVYFLHPSAGFANCTGQTANACGVAACTAPGSPPSTYIVGPLRFTLSKGGISKSVIVEFTLTQVGRIYVQ